MGGTTQTDLWGVCGPSYKVDAAKECFMVNKFPSAKPDRVKNIPYFRPETLKNHIPLACTYLYYPYKAVPCSLARLAPSLVGARCECSLVRRAPSLVGARRERIVGLLQSEPEVRDLLHVMGVNRFLLKPVKWRN